MRLAAVLLLLAACGQAGPPGRSEVFGPSRVLDAREPAGSAPVAERAKPAISFLALGDTGWGGRVLRENAQAMDRLAAEEPIDFVLLLGDNVYPDGVTSADDPRWRECFEEPFALPHLAVPVLASLGNHDHRGDVQAQVDYGQHNPRWRLPAAWYRFAMPFDEHEMEILVLDTTPILTGHPFAIEQLAWLDAALAAPRPRWRIVAGHHPVLSHGAHGAERAVVEALAPRFELHGVDLYLAGHDHDLQVLDSGRGWLQVVSGAGSSTRDTRYGERTLFAAAEPGFVRVGLSSRELWIEVFSAARSRLFGHRRGID